MKLLFSILVLSLCLPITRDDIYDDSWALVIGINDYQNIQGLDYAVKDAESVEKMLVDLFGFDKKNVTVLKDREATKLNIIQEFSNITRKAKSTDRVLIFFAGHGETESLPGGGELGYLMPVDGNKEDLYVSSVSMNELRTISQRSDAKHILCLVDACYGGIAAAGGSRGLVTTSPDDPHYIKKITQYKSRQVISAGGRDELVVEKPEWGHSAFTKNLLAGLEDWRADTDYDGIVTTQELGVFLKRTVIQDSQSQQNPKIRNIGNQSDEGEFVFFHHSNIESLSLEVSSSTSVVLSENINNKSQDLNLNLGDTPQWEYIRDKSFGLCSDDDTPFGFYQSYDLFKDDGKRANSYAGEMFFNRDYCNFNIVWSRKLYASAYSESYFTYGFKIITLQEWEQENFFKPDVYYGAQFQIGGGWMQINPPIDHSNHQDVPPWLCKLADYYNSKQYSITIGYRILPEETADFNAKSGIFATFKVGNFSRKASKKTKILPQVE